MSPASSVRLRARSERAAPPGDFDFDYDIDLFDLARFQFAMSTPAFADSDGDRIANFYETNDGRFINSQATGTDPDNPDTDGDSISDGDEVYGTVDGLALRFLGANPLRKDIFLEIDWLNATTNGEAPARHKPDRDQIKRVEDAFAAAPIINLDGSVGIELHVDTGQPPYGRGNYAGANDVVDITSPGINAEFLVIKDANFDANRHGYFHYAISCKRQSRGGDKHVTLGTAEIDGDDFILSMGYYVDGGTSADDDIIGNTIMHELGHNLDLRHGGDEHRLYKPNYNSIMNYRYAFAGLDDDGCDAVGDGLLDFSEGSRIILDEGALDEGAGVCGGVPINWNGVGGFEDPVAWNINCVAGWSTPCGVLDSGHCDEDGDEVDHATCDVLSDFDDWGHIESEGFTGILQADRSPPEVITCFDMISP